MKRIAGTQPHRSHPAQPALRQAARRRYEELHKAGAGLRGVVPLCLNRRRNRFLLRGMALVSRPTPVTSRLTMMIAMFVRGLQV